MKTIYVTALAIASLTLASCKKTYNCDATDASGNKVTLQCENCSKKDVEDYEKEIKDKGYSTVSCDKK